MVHHHPLQDVKWIHVLTQFVQVKHLFLCFTMVRNVCQRHYITSDKEWDPMSDHFAEAEMNVPRFIGATSYHDHRSLIQPEDMVRRWGNSVETAILTLEEATNQRAVHSVRGGPWK
jgi:hypothetical protein